MVDLLQLLSLNSFLDHLNSILMLHSKVQTNHDRLLESTSTANIHKLMAIELSNILIDLSTPFHLDIH